jgi:hypothetical protein
VRFWFMRNSQGLYDRTGRNSRPSRTSTSWTIWTAGTGVVFKARASRTRGSHLLTNLNPDHVVPCMCGLRDNKTNLRAAHRS